jgi:hypothetical protein
VRAVAPDLLEVTPRFGALKFPMFTPIRCMQDGAGYPRRPKVLSATVEGSQRLVYATVLPLPVFAAVRRVQDSAAESRRPQVFAIAVYDTQRVAHATGLWQPVLAPIGRV